MIILCIIMSHVFTQQCLLCNVMSANVFLTSVTFQQITVPIVGCNRPKHKPLHELVNEYNSQVKHHTNYCWFIPPAGETNNLAVFEPSVDVYL